MAAADLKHLNFSGLGHHAGGHGSSVFDRQSGPSVSSGHHTGGHLHSVGNPHHYHSNHHNTHNSHSAALSSFSQVNSTESVFHYKYLKEFRVDQCPLFLQHKCQQHRPFTCFHWHFQNQRRRRPVRRQRDGTFNYSADVYCSKYDETTGICPDGDECPYLHRTAGDTERRYHLKYYKTGMCVHDTDNRGFCVKNGSHCAFAHGTNDLRPAVYDIRELQAIENGETDGVIGQNALDKERCLLNDDPKWLDTTYVLANYKTEPCKKPPRLCRQGYACPQFHNNKDKRRSPKKFKYRSTPCPNVKSGDEWGDPVSCEAGDACQYCHTRTEQQFHPEIYKSTKCNDIQNTSYCPRGAFCAFAHVEQETVSLESPPTEPSNGHSISDIISTALPENPTDGDLQQQSGGQPSGSNGVKGRHASNPASHAHLSNNGNVHNGHGNPDMFAQQNRAPGSQFTGRNGSITPPFEENGVASPVDGQKFNHLADASSLGTSIDSAMVQTATNSYSFAKNRFLSGDHVNASNRDALLRRQLFAIENDPTITTVEKAQKRASLLLEVTAVTTANSVVTTFSNGSLFPSLGQSDHNPSVQMDPVLGTALDELSLGDPFDGSKSRKSSGFSSSGGSGGSTAGPAGGDGSKSRQYSGYDMGNKSRNCSGNSISASLVNSGLLNGSAPVLIPSSTASGSVTANHNGGGPQNHTGTSPKGGSPMQQISNGIMTNNGGPGSDNSGENNFRSSGNQLGLFDLTSSSNGQHQASGSQNAAAAVESARLKDELLQTRARMATWGEDLQRTQGACEVWKKEATLANKKAELALKHKDEALLKLAQMQTEIDKLSGGPLLHVIRRVADLKTAPMGVLKTIEWQLRKDLQEVEKVMRAYHPLESNPWMGTGGLNGGNNRLFDFPSVSAGGGGGDWGLNLISNQQSLYGSLAQQ